MTRAEECRRFAAECLALAQVARTANDRARLLEMAHAWNDLAIKLAAAQNDQQKN